MGLVQDIFGGSTSTTTNTPIVGGGTQQQFLQGLFGTGLGSNSQGYGYLQGMPGYQGQLSPDQSQTLLPGVYGAYSPTNQGTSYLGQMLNSGQFTPQNQPTNINSANPFQQQMANYGQSGSAGGYPGTLMSNMAQYGGTGGPGNYAMSNLMQYGNTGYASGVPQNTMAQTGGYGSWGSNLTGMAGGQGAASSALSPNASTGGQQALQQMISGGGNPIDQTSAWNSMVGAQQRNINENMAQLNESMGSSDNRFSTAYGTAATDYLSQTSANQNALLGQMTATAGENAQNRLLSAGSTLGQLGQGAASQMSSQDYGAGNLLANLGSGASNQIAQNAMTGASSLYGGENTAAQSLYSGQNQMLGNYMNYSLGMGNLGVGQQNANTSLLGLGANTASGLNSALGSNLSLGSNLGQQQMSNSQSAINNQYQNWLYQQPQNNALLPYMYGAATGYTGNTQSSSTSGMLGGLGSVMGGIGSMSYGGVFSDKRLKFDLHKVGKVADKLNLYTYRYKFDPANERLGFVAQEVNKLFPEAVIKGNKYKPWMIRENVLLESLAKVA